MRLTPWPLVFVVACGITSARATSWDYTISVPDGREATFDLPFPVEFAGAVTIEASWSGPRVLFFGVEGPGIPCWPAAPGLRRSGSISSPTRPSCPAEPVGS